MASINSTFDSENPRSHVLGDDESILLAIPQTIHIQRWDGLKQQRLIFAPLCLVVLFEEAKPPSSLQRATQVFCERATF